MQIGPEAEELMPWPGVTSCHKALTFSHFSASGPLWPLYCVPSTGLVLTFLHILGFQLPLSVNLFISTKLQGSLPSPSSIIGTFEVRSPNYDRLGVSLALCHPSPSSDMFSFTIVVIFLMQVLLRKIVFNKHFCLASCLISRVQ